MIMSNPNIEVDQARKNRERSFHDHAFEHGSRQPVFKFYTVTRQSAALYSSLVLKQCADMNVLEYGCGQGSSAFELGRNGANVTGIDISPVAVDQAREKAKELGLETATFEVMDAEDLTFAPDQFDRICGSGILHHLDLDRAGEAIRRVLKPNGTAIFLEPLGHNPLINAYRKRTPQFRSPDEHPLLLKDLAELQGSFGRVDISYFHLTVLATVPLRSTPIFTPLLSLLEMVDRAILAIPPMRRYAWIAVIRCRNPRY
jgi:ubiquinone/menaquinone biosynthesis C-methylase UbiE